VAYSILLELSRPEYDNRHAARERAGFSEKAFARRPLLKGIRCTAPNGAWDAHYDDDENCREIMRLLDEQQPGRLGQPRLRSTGIVARLYPAKLEDRQQGAEKVREKQT